MTIPRLAALLLGALSGCVGLSSSFSTDPSVLDGGATGGGAAVGGGPAGGGAATGGGTSAVGGGAASGGGSAAGGGGSSSVGSPDGGLFLAAEPWTRDISASAVSSRSAAIISALKSLGGWGSGTMQIDFSIPLFFADASTPRKTITANLASGTYCYGGPDCEAVPLQMPVPANANIEGSSDFTCDTSYATDGQGDCHLLVVERSEKKLYELYNSTASGTGLVALGAFVWDLTKAYPDAPRGERCTSADAAGMPIAGLLVTADEVASGLVAHAIRFILPNPSMKPGVYVHPASHAGGPSSKNANAPPYGVRFRLAASFDETPYTRPQRVVLQAMKTYGLILSDGGNLPLTFADDRLSTAKWADLGIAADTYQAIPVTAFEVVELGEELPTGDCARWP